MIKIINNTADAHLFRIPRDIKLKLIIIDHLK
jgi:hypothetical protein